MSDVIMAADRHLQEALRLLRSDYDTRQAAFELEIAALRQRIKAIELVLSPSSPGVKSDPRDAENGLPFRSEQTIQRPPILPTPTREVARKIRGLTQPEALIKIAQENGGVLQTAPAKAILLNAGLIRGNPKNALGHVFQLLKDSSRFEKFGYRFEKIRPGEYRLLPTGSGFSTQDDNNAQEAPSLGTPASAPHPPGTDFITVEALRTG